MVVENFSYREPSVSSCKRRVVWHWSMCVIAILLQELILLRGNFLFRFNLTFWRDEYGGLKKRESKMKNISKSVTINNLSCMNERKRRTLREYYTCKLINSNLKYLTKHQVSKGHLISMKGDNLQWNFNYDKTSDNVKISRF